METNRNKKVFGTYQNVHDAQRAVEELLNMGYTSEEISVISKNAEEIGTIEGVETATETGLKAGAATGATLGGLGGLLASLGMLAIPGIGPILAAGPIAATLAGAVTGGALGGTIGTLGGALIDAGVDETDAKYLDERFDAGDVIVYVETDEVRYNDVSKTLGYDTWRNTEADPENYSGKDFSKEPVSDNIMDPEVAEVYNADNKPVNDPIDRSYDDLMAGAARVNPVDPTVSTGYTGEEFSTFKEEPMKDNVHDAKYEADKLGRRLNDNGEPFEEAKDWVGEKVDQVKDKAGEFAEDVKETFDGDGVDRVGHDVRDQYNDAENKVQDKVTETKHNVEETAEKAARRVDNAGEPLEDVQNWTGDKVSEAKHGAEEIIEKVKNRLDD